MKKIGIILSMVIVLCSSVIANPFADPSLVGHWPFEETTGTVVADVSGNNRDFTCSVCPTFNALESKKGNAIKFESNNDFLLLTNGFAELFEGQSHVTVAMWIYPFGATGQHNIFGPSTGNFYMVIRNDGDVGASAHFAPPPNTNNQPVSFDQWNHFVYRKDATTNSIWIDGVEVFSGTDVAAIPSSNDDSLQLGLYRNHAAYAFEGYIDEFAVWHKALSAAEIQEVIDDASAPADTTPPSVPQNVGLTGITENSISLNWSASTDAESGVDHYNVYRDGVIVAQPTANSFSDVGLTPATTYYYNVSAVNGAGLESNPSSVFAVTTLADAQAPSVLNVSATTSLVTIVFDEPIDPVTGEDISRYALSNGKPVTDAIVSGNAVILVTDDQHEMSVSMTGIEDLFGNSLTGTGDYSLPGCFP